MGGNHTFYYLLNSEGPWTDKESWNLQTNRKSHILSLTRALQAEERWENAGLLASNVIFSFLCPHYNKISPKDKKYP